MASVFEADVSDERMEGSETERKDSLVLDSKLQVTCWARAGARDALKGASCKHHSLLHSTNTLSRPRSLQEMPPKHRFHQAGVGSRTGMRPPSSAANLADFLSAGKAAMDNPAYGDDDDDDDDEADQESDQEDSQVDAYEERSRLSSRKGRPSGKGSSSRIDDSNMDVAHSE